MAGLMRSDKINGQNLDQLLQFNELIRSIVDAPNLADIIKSIQDAQAALQTQQDAYTAAGDNAVAKTLELKAATEANQKSISDLTDAKNEADRVKAAADISVEKSQRLLKDLAAAQAEFDVKTQAANDALAKREQAVSDEEDAAAATQTQADAMKADYEAKLDALKKLTGG